MTRLQAVGVMLVALGLIYALLYAAWLRKRREHESAAIAAERSRTTRDHAPHARHDKEHAFTEAAFGMLGLETSLSVISDVMVGGGLLDWAGVARVMSVAPARIAGLASHGQALAVGSPAHLTLVDPAATVTVDRSASLSLSRNNPWHGRTLRGAVHATVFGGRVTAQKGAIA